MGVIDTLSRWFSVKESAAFRAIVSLTGGRPVWTPRDYAKLAKEGYQQNVWVYACINQIQTACAGVPWVLYQDPATANGKVEEIPAHPLLNLIRRPNPEQGQAAFIASTVGCLETSGNNYIEGVGPDTGPNKGKPLELWTLRPDRVTIKPDAKQRVGGYHYRAGSYTQDWDATQIMHTKLWNPLHDWYGMSPIEAAARSIDHGNEAEAFEVALLQNSAMPSGLLTTDQALTDPQFDRLQKDLMSRTGAPKAGRPWVLEAGLKWQQSSLDPSTLGTNDAGKWSAQKVCSAFRVPGELVGLMPATYQNRREAKVALYTEVALPLLDLLRDDFNRWLVPRFGDRLRLDYDRDSIEALREDRERLFTYMTNATWLSVNEKRQATGYDDVPAGEVILVPASSLPLDEATAPAPEVTVTDATKSVKAFNLTTPKAKRAYVTETQRLRKGYAKAIKAKAAAIFANEAKAVAAAYAKGGEKAALAAVEKGAWSKMLTASLTVIAEAFAERTAGQFKGAAGPEETKGLKDIWRAAVSKWVQRVTADKVTQITDTTKAKIKGAIGAGLEAGDGTQGIADRLQTAISSMSEYRAQLIARTECLGAQGAGSQIGARATGLKLRKEWMHGGGAHPRDWHEAMDGETVDMDEAFSNGLMFPGDPSAEPEEICNCFPADTVVTADQVKRAYRRWYDGDLVEITTALGDKLSGTPNHPVLTDRGWIALGSLKEGDYVISGGFRKEVGATDLDVDHMPTTIGQVFDALAELRAPVGMRGTNMDFHGDGRRSQVDVVTADRKLLDSVDTADLEPSSEQLLAGADLDERALPMERLLVHMLLRVALASTGNVSGGHSGLAGVGVKSGRYELRGLRGAPRGDAGIDDQASDNSSVYAKAPGKRQFTIASNVEPRHLGGNIAVAVGPSKSHSVGHIADSGAALVNPLISGNGGHPETLGNVSSALAGLVETANVVKVNRRQFAGHVYNLQTNTGWYSANNIIAHNCGCVEGYVPVRDADGAVMTEDE